MYDLQHMLRVTDTEKICVTGYTLHKYGTVVELAQDGAKATCITLTDIPDVTLLCVWPSLYANSILCS